MLEEEMYEDWRQWCRLCGKISDTNVNVWLKKEQESNLTTANKNTISSHLAVTIQKFFAVNIKQNDFLPKVLCEECFALLTSLDKLVIRVAKVQRMFNDLLERGMDETPKNYKQFRLKYDICEEIHEEDFCESIPQVTFMEPKSDYTSVSVNKTVATIKTSNPLELPYIEVKNEVKNNLLEEENPSLETDDDLDCSRDIIDSPVDINKPQVFSKMEEIGKNPIQNGILQTKSKRKACIKRENTNNICNEESQNTAPISCSECARKFKRMQSYRIHMKRVHFIVLPPSEFPCTQCKRVFTTNFLLKQHSRLHLPLEERRVLPCQHCEKKFLSNSEVLKHVKHFHMKEKYYICEECGLELRSKVSLRVHMLIHTGETPFKCEVCQKAFREKSKLKAHMEKHDENKQICSHCGHQSNSRFNLRRHMLVHSENRRFKCDYCGSAFKRSRALKVHLIVHTGLKPYSCNFCERTFSTGSSCRLHKKTQHPEELAALEASGGGIVYACNVPSLETLKAITQTSDNLKPVGSKQSKT